MLKKENGRLKEEIFINKTVSMKVEQNNYPLSSRVSAITSLVELGLFSLDLLRILGSLKK